MSSTTKTKVEFKRLLPELGNPSHSGYAIHHTHVTKEWGYEIWFANEGLYCGKEIFIKKFNQSSNGRYHYHKNKLETFYVVKGILYIDILVGQGRIESYKLKAKDSFTIKPYMPHRFSAKFRSCQFIEASTFHEDKDSYYTDESPEWIEFINKG